MAAAAPAMGGAGGAAAPAMGGADRAESVPYFVVKGREKTQTSAGSILFTKITAGREAAAVRDFASRFVYFDPSSRTESGFSKDSIKSASPDTLYTWIIKQTAGGPILVAARTRGAQEIGTLHVNLNAFTEATIPGKVVSAGEMKRTSSGITYNLLSGSFMEPLFRASATVTKAKEREIAVSVAAAVFDAMFPGAAISTGDQLISPSTLPHTIDDNRNFYNSYLNRNTPKMESRAGGAAEAVRTLSFGGARRKGSRSAHRKGSRSAHRKGSRSAHRKGSRSAHRKGSRSAHRKGSRSAHRKGSRSAHRKGSRSAHRKSRKNHRRRRTLRRGQ